MHRLDEGFKLAKLAAARKRRLDRLRRGLLAVGVLALLAAGVFLGVNTNLLTRYSAPEVPDVETRPDEVEAPDVYEATIVDLAGDPLLISVGDMSGNPSELRRIATPETPLAERGAAEVFLLEDTMVASSRRFMATLPSSPQDFAFYQQQTRSTPPAAAPGPADAIVAPQVPDELAGDIGGGWAETIDGQEEALPDFAPDVVANTTTSQGIRQASNRRPARQDIVLQVLIERDLASLTSETPFSQADLEAFGAALSSMTAREGLQPGDVIALRGVPQGGPNPWLAQISITSRAGFVAALARADDGTVEMSADPWVGQNLLALQEEAGAEPNRQYRLLDAIYSTAVRNGVPTAVLGEAIRLLSQAFDLDAFASPRDKLILAYGPDEVAVPDGRLLYAAVQGPERRLECFVYRATPADEFSCFAETQQGQTVTVPDGMITPVNGVLTSKFGPRMHPIFNEVRVHTGVDWKAPSGAPVIAAYAGSVVSAGNAGGYGNLIRLKHSNGQETRYAHLQAFAEGIAPGVAVTAGQLIGYVGTTGNSTGPHLHFEVRVADAPVDPLAQQVNQVEEYVSDGSAVKQLVEQIVQVESAGDPNAKNPLSSATGAGQFISSTWLRMMRTYRPELANSMSEQQLLALRTDPTIAREMVENLAREGEAYLKARGHAVTAGRLYLCHFLGMQDAHRVLSSDGALPLVELLAPAVISANPFLTRMTIADVQSWADNHMKGAKRPAASAPVIVATVTPGFTEFRNSVERLFSGADEVAGTL